MSAGTEPVRLLIVGHGRMGRLVDSHAPEHGCVVAGSIDAAGAADPATFSAARWPDVDVAIDFSTAAAFVQNFPKMAAMGLNVVVGTTGWQQDEPALRRVASDAGIGVVAAANFSPGVALFAQLAAEAAKLFAGLPAYGAWLHEIHHAAKQDAPSGTALTLTAALRTAGYAHPIDVTSTRAGHVPGTHTLGFDGPAETVTLAHTTRDRATFAHGALTAARWVRQRTGWFGIRDVLGLSAPMASTATEQHTEQE